jgi:hypothetical protein
MRHQHWLPLWSFRHICGDTLECSVNAHPIGLEFRARMNAHLLHSEVFRSPEELLRSAQRSKDRLESRGWTMVAADSKP